MSAVAPRSRTEIVRDIGGDENRDSFLGYLKEANAEVKRG